MPAATRAAIERERVGQAQPEVRRDRVLTAEHQRAPAEDVAEAGVLRIDLGARRYARDQPERRLVHYQCEAGGDVGDEVRLLIVVVEEDVAVPLLGNADRRYDGGGLPVGRQKPQKLDRVRPDRREQRRQGLGGRRLGFKGRLPLCGPGLSLLARGVRCRQVRREPGERDCANQGRPAHHNG